MLINLYVKDQTVVHAQVHWHGNQHVNCKKKKINQMTFQSDTVNKTLQAWITYAVVLYGIKKY